MLKVYVRWKCQSNNWTRSWTMDIMRARIIGISSRGLRNVRVKLNEKGRRKPIDWALISLRQPINAKWTSSRFVCLLRHFRMVKIFASRKTDMTMIRWSQCTSSPQWRDLRNSLWTPMVVALWWIKTILCTWRWSLCTYSSANNVAYNDYVKSSLFAPNLCSQSLRIFRHFFKRHTRVPLHFSFLQTFAGR